MITNTKKLLFFVPSMALLIMIVGLSSSCSLILDWSEDNQPCNIEAQKSGLPECNPGYSCAVGRCVKDGSIPQGEGCSRDHQCSGYPANICAEVPLFNKSFCSASCDIYYSASSNECPSGYYCRPDESSLTDSKVRGACSKSECSLDGNSGCSTGFECIKITETANACLRPCSKDSSIKFSCNADSTCQPLGPDTLTLACIKRSKLPQTRDSICDFGEITCNQGLACVNTGADYHCKLLCDPAQDAVLPDSCTSCNSEPEFDDAFGVCD
ncbi:MAG: hypothetical protein JW841_03670 [Deltaproteobacteria bacterium]|nr:hypothetical protein [Deltaproteobacteria bacterium]